MDGGGKGFGGKVCMIRSQKKEKEKTGFQCIYCLVKEEE
jgi:hypothetical protein